MGRHDRSRAEQEHRWSVVTIGAAGLLIVLAVGAVIWSALRPYSNQDLAESPIAAEASGSRVARASSTSAAAPPVARRSVASSTPAQIARAAAQAEVTLPEQMVRLLPGSRQLLAITGGKLGSNTGTLRIFNEEDGEWVEVLSAPSRFGTNGLTDGETRHSGTRTTPTGLWWIGPFVFGHAANPPQGTLMPYRQTTANSYWSWQKDSTYNTWVESPKKFGGEHLATISPQYEFAFNTGYNALPNERVIGRGTAIFLHVFDPPSYNNGFSAGCVAVSRADMIRVFQIVDPKRNPSLVIGTEQDGTKTCVRAY